MEFQCRNESVSQYFGLTVDTNIYITGIFALLEVADFCHTIFRHWCATIQTQKKTVMPNASKGAGPCEEAACVRACTYVHWQTGYGSVSKGVCVCARHTLSGRRSGDFRLVFQGLLPSAVKMPTTGAQTLWSQIFLKVSESQEPGREKNTHATKKENAK